VRFTYGPILSADGTQVEGVFTPCTETTEQVIGARRLDTLRKLGIKDANVRSVEGACVQAMQVLADDPHDLPFAAVYLIDGQKARLTASTVEIKPAQLPPLVSLTHDDGCPWPLATVARSRDTVDIADLSTLGLTLPGSPYGEPARRAVLLPLGAPSPEGIAGVLIAAVSPHRPLDTGYRTFFELVARHIGAAIADARASEHERARAESLAQLDRAKTEFFSNVSHEFRTPLTLMLGPLEEAMAKAPRPVRESLRVVQRNGARLLKLVNTLLDFARLEAGRIRARYQQTDVAELTAELASSFSDACERAGLTLRLQIPDAPVWTWVDRDMWEKVVLNHVSNAVKFTLAGEIAVSIDTLGDRLRLRVADTGVGIPEASRGHVFERFHRLQDGRGRSHEGSGIGLALVQELVKLHGGRIEVESELDRGSVFTVEVPIGYQHLPPEQVVRSPDADGPSHHSDAYVQEAMGWLLEPSAAAPAPPSRDVKRARVLVADDNADLRHYVQRLLEPEHEVVTARDGVEALALARETQPDLIVTDVMMPRLDGFGLMRALREDEALKAVPILMLSARAGEEARIEGREAGADDYLAKPFSARDLRSRVGSLLAGEALRSQAFASLRDADERKSAFIATLSHELRNPLAPLRNGLEILRRSQDSPTQEKVRSMMDRQLTHMVRLIDDLLDVSRIGRGKIDLQRARIELGHALQHAIEASRPFIEQGGHELKVEVPHEPLTIDADMTRLAQVFINLLTNAAKFTPPGGTITVRVEHDSEHAHIRIADTGLGIEPAMQHEVFTMFTQIHRAQGGLGIGLALARGLMQMHGGDITLRSAGAGQGSEFTVTLPLAEAQHAPASTGDPQPSTATPAELRRVLVADDNRDSARSLVLILRMQGHHTAIAFDGEEALSLAERFRPDVMLLDIGMPKRDGYEVAQAVRATDWGQDVTLIALTGWGQPDDRRQSEAAGFDHHLLKPVAAVLLEQLLRDSPPSSWQPLGDELPGAALQAAAQAARNGSSFTS
jgi:signal transduction histidine kinase